MKALAVSLLCLAVSAAPALAFGRAGGGRPGGFHHGGAHPGGGHGHHHFGAGVLYDPYAPDLTPDVSEPPSADFTEAEPPLAEPAPAPACACAPAATTVTGPHILYIGHKPAIHGPKVIYGTDF